MLLLENILKHTRPENIGFLSFTNTAIEEAKDRAKAKFPFRKKRYIYFNTIHKFAFNNTVIQKRTIKYDDIRDLNEQGSLELNTDVSKYARTPVTIDDKILRIINLAREECRPLEEVWAEDNNNIPKDRMLRFRLYYEAFKSMHGLVDFTDQLYNFVHGDNLPLPISYLIVDEAQDLNALQWQVVYKAAENCKELIIAGDDDQTIFAWNGANARTIVEMRADVVCVLPKTYRLPKPIFDAANVLTSHLGVRREKAWQSSGRPGNIAFRESLRTIPLCNRSDWLILVRNNYQLQAVEEFLSMEGLFYSRNGVAAVHYTHHKAICAYYMLQRGEHIPTHLADKFQVWSYNIGLSMKKRIPRCMADYPKVDFKLPWNEQYKQKMSIALVQYCLALEANGFDFVTMDEPRIDIRTIHTAKGLECENVAVLTDVSRSTYLEYLKEPDNEHRVFYVAITRAKKNLYIIDPQTDINYPLRTILGE
jgi:superfamily I DNA/RNA helicase